MDLSLKMVCGYLYDFAPQPKEIYGVRNSGAIVEEKKVSSSPGKIIKVPDLVVDGG